MAIGDYWSDRPSMGFQIRPTEDGMAWEAWVRFGEHHTLVGTYSDPSLAVYQLRTYLMNLVRIDHKRSGLVRLMLDDLSRWVDQYRDTIYPNQPKKRKRPMEPINNIPIETQPMERMLDYQCRPKEKEVVQDRPYPECDPQNTDGMSEQEIRMARVDILTLRLKGLLMSIPRVQSLDLFQKGAHIRIPSEDNRNDVVESIPVLAFSEPRRKTLQVCLTNMLHQEIEDVKRAIREELDRL